MRDFIKPIIGPAVAIAMITAAGSVAAGSNGKNIPYPPVPQVNKNNAIPQKSPLAARPALAPKSGVLAESAGGNTGAIEQGPRMGVERPAPERQVPTASTRASGSSGGNGLE